MEQFFREYFLNVCVTLYLYFVVRSSEGWFPAENGHGFKGTLTNFLYTAVFLLSVSATAAVLSNLVNIHPRTCPNHGLPSSFAILGIYLLLNDLIYYWYHRAQHTYRSLWFIHRLHHSDRELNVSSSHRTHWIEAPVQTILIAIPITYIVGIDMLAMGLFPIITTIWLLFTHANWRLDLGQLTPFICGPQLHRIHHSRLPEHFNKNFAQYFPFLDILFGTYYAPKKNEFPPTGLKGPG